MIVDELKEMSKRMEELSNAIFINPLSEDFFEAFTRKRLELVKSIMDEEPNSIRELAKRVDRNIKNVFEDLQLLNNLKIIEFINEGRCKKPVIKKRTIIMSFKLR